MKWWHLRRRWMRYWRDWQRTVYERAGAEGTILKGELLRAASVCNFMWRPVKTWDYLWMRFRLRFPLPGDTFEDFQRDMRYRVVGVDFTGPYCEARSGQWFSQFPDWDAPLPEGVVRAYEELTWDDMRRMTTR